jgi:hypothetical protein
VAAIQFCLITDLLKGDNTLRPTRDQQITLNDLLERVLDKGMVLNADILITVAGVPLIGVCLSAAIAGMETMTRYGLLTQWDQETRRAGSRLPFMRDI